MKIRYAGVLLQVHVGRIGKAGRGISKPPSPPSPSPTPPALFYPPASRPRTPRTRWLRLRVPRLSRLLALVKAPDPPRLVGLDALCDGLRELLEHRLRRSGSLEEAAGPFSAFGLFLLAELALGDFDFGFLVVDDIHVALCDAGGDVLPCAVGLEGVLLVEGSDDEGGGFGGAGVVGFEGF